MAHGFLQSFDKDLNVKSAGTEASGKLNSKAVEVMNELKCDISHHSSESVDLYLNEEWDYVITVCGGANESCPVFVGEVKNRIHMGYEDPSDAVGTDEFVMSEFRRIRDLIKTDFFEFHKKHLMTNT